MLAATFEEFKDLTIEYKDTSVYYNRLLIPPPTAVIPLYIVNEP